MEIHTYSSLNKQFLSQYKNTLRDGDINIVFINDHTLTIKKMDPLDDSAIHRGFNNPALIIIRTREALERFILAETDPNSVLLMMSSGNFGGMDYDQLIRTIQKKL